MRTCIKCGGDTTRDFDPDCHHDFGEDLRAALHELYWGPAHIRVIFYHWRIMRNVEVVGMSS